MGEEYRRNWHPEVVANRGSDAEVLIAGAGPAGMEAARLLGQRGYRVMLASMQGPQQQSKGHSAKGTLKHDSRSLALAVMRFYRGKSKAPEQLISTRLEARRNLAGRSPSSRGNQPSPQA